MLGAMADALPLHERLALRGLLVPALSNSLLRVVGSSEAMLTPLLHNTATPTVVRGGNVSNVIPTEVSVDLDGRALPGTSPADLVAELEALAQDLATFELVDEEPAVTAQPDLSLLPLLADVVRERDPGSVPIPMLLPGYTDARYVSKLGVQTYGFLPMRLPPHITTALIHSADERVPAEAIEFGVRCLTDVISRYR
jgi:acetylornithine deacetylase/succinyl-diaminopimelate desuccinylase-like protein